MKKKKKQEEKKIFSEKKILIYFVFTGGANPFLQAKSFGCIFWHKQFRR